MFGLPAADGELERKACGAWDEPNSRLRGTSEEVEGAHRIARDEG